MSKETLSTSEKEVPKHKNALEEKYKEKEPLNPDNIKEQRSLLPDPSGWRLLVLPFTPKEKTKGGVILTDKTIEDSQLTASVALVLDTGDDAYKDKEKFPSGAWCKQDDWVLITRYAGSRIRIDGGELRIINDDEILAVIDDPRDILPANIL